jgi:hypothetical protein
VLYRSILPQAVRTGKEEHMTIDNNRYHDFEQLVPTPLPDVFSVLPAPFEKRAVDPAPSTLSLEICTAFKQRKKKT